MRKLIASCVTAAAALTLTVTGNALTTSASAAPPPIVGGHDVQQGDAPWIAQLRYVKSFGNHACTGALIAPEWVLSAGHCRGDDGTGDVRIGNVNWDQGEQLHVDRIELLGSAADLSLWHLTKPVTNGTFVKVADENPAVSSTVTAYGFGAQSDSSSHIGKSLKAADQTVADVDTCQSSHGAAMCLQAVDGHVAPGDSGGPVIAGGVEYGVVSTYVKNDRDRSHAAKVTAGRDWIKQTAGV